MIMDTKSPIFFIVIIAVVFILAFAIKVSIPEKINNFKPTQLNSEQVSKLIQDGLIPLYKSLPTNTNDENMEIVYETPYGDCYLFKDIFGRYYCRW